MFSKPTRLFPEVVRRQTSHVTTKMLPSKGSKGHFRVFKIITCKKSPHFNGLVLFGASFWRFSPFVWCPFERVIYIYIYSFMFFFENNIWQMFFFFFFQFHKFGWLGSNRSTHRLCQRTRVHRRQSGRIPSCHRIRMAWFIMCTLLLDKKSGDKQRTRRVPDI